MFAMACRNPLILVPTAHERELFEKAFANSRRHDLMIAQCGFGPIAAAARTLDLLSRDKPAAVWLVGIAGTFDATLEIGRAYQFGQVACHGVGVGGGTGFVPAAELGWPQVLDAPVSDPLKRPNDILPLVVGQRDSKATTRLLLTACAASGDASEAAFRRSRWPQATAEDMEGFGVALACHLRQVPCTIIRGISNWVGNRDKSNWQVTVAVQAAADKVISSLEA